MSDPFEHIRHSRSALDESRQKAVAAFHKLYRLLWYAATPDDEVWVAEGLDPPPRDSSSPRPRSLPLHAWPMSAHSREWAEPICTTLKGLARLLGTPSKNYPTLAAEIADTGLMWTGRSALTTCYSTLRVELSGVSRSHRFAASETKLDRSFLAAAKRVLKGIEVFESQLIFLIPKEEAERLLATADGVNQQATSQSSSEQRADSSPNRVAKTTRSRRPGRPKRSYETVQFEAKLKKEWKRAHESGVRKIDFAKEKKMTLKQFDELLDRVAKRERLSE